ncbi:Fatty acyl-CoA reductase [Rhynchospora pubera]|uniref:Fatty acyl-CoA reductase n=1 Tax=Rhynchospora pubera TaxID=906938 RepID=A0AAV8FZA5_9POAL|nr:Fatty acyl-CoA reductase [Rhynchospora pubera]
MESSCLNYSHVLRKPPSVFSSQKVKLQQWCTFPFPLQKKNTTKITSFYLNGTFSTSNRNSLFPKCQAVSIENAVSVHSEIGNEGIGIVSFLQGKNFLVTGATGFLAKVLIEKILRTNPDVGKFYIIIKARDDEAAKERLINEIVNTELFKSLQEIHGNNYREFMLKKIIPVLGNVRETGIGIKPEIAREIEEEVDIIVNSAASTTFDERYDVALDINTLGPYRLMSFAKRMKRLKLFLQVSTAYVNGQRQGAILERPFGLGDTIASEISSSNYCPVLDIEEEIKLAFSSTAKDDASNVQEMKDLGLKRAKLYGWQDTYVFTKAMGEMIINSMRGEIPVVTIRPSVIESTLKEPFPGWMEGNRMMDPIVLYYGKGQLTGFLVETHGVLDVVPADMVVNATVAAMAKHGSCTDPGMHIYHVASSNVNPLVFSHLANIMLEHFSVSPYMDPTGQPIPVQPMKLFHEMSKFSDFIYADAMEKSAKVAGPVSNERVSDRLKALCMKLVEQAKYLATIYEPYTFYGGRFDNTNTEELIYEMSEEERENFQFDVESIDWEDYIANVHIPGLRKHVKKGRGMP